MPKTLDHRADEGDFCGSKYKIWGTSIKMFGFFTEAKKVAKRTSAENYAIIQACNYFHMNVAPAEKIFRKYFPDIWNGLDVKESFNNDTLRKHDIAYMALSMFGHELNEGCSVLDYGKAIVATWVENNSSNLHPDLRIDNHLLSYWKNEYSPISTLSNEVLRCQSCSQYIWANPQLVTFLCKRCGTENKKIRW